MSDSVLHQPVTKLSGIQTLQQALVSSLGYTWLDVRPPLECEDVGKVLDLHLNLEDVLANAVSLFNNTCSLCMSLSLGSSLARVICPSTINRNITHS